VCGTIELSNYTTILALMLSLSVAAQLYDLRACCWERKWRQLYLNTQSVPHSKNTPSRLYKPVS